MLNPTPIERLVDEERRPYFLPDSKLTLERFRERLRDKSSAGRADLLSEVLRNARPDDVLSMISPKEIAEMWSEVEAHLGERRPYWSWFLEAWEDFCLGRL